MSSTEAAFSVMKFNCFIVHIVHKKEVYINEKKHSFTVTQSRVQLFQDGTTEKSLKSVQVWRSASVSHILRSYLRNPTNGGSNLQYTSGNGAPSRIYIL
jgi:hypothetical protein